jgi:hypothetical protein
MQTDISEKLRMVTFGRWQATGYVSFTHLLKHQRHSHQEREHFQTRYTSIVDSMERVDMGVAF